MSDPLIPRLSARIAPLVAWWEQSLPAAVIARLEPAKPQVLASAIAYNLFFALVPLLVALVALVSIIGRDESTLAELEQLLASVLPESIVSFITSVITQVENTIGGATGTVISIAIVVALWSGARASDILIAALTTIEGRKETRPWVVRRLVGMLATAGLAITLLAAGVLLAAGDSVASFLDDMGLEGAAGTLSILRLPVAGAVTGAFLWLFYRQGPPEPFPRSFLAAVVSMAGIGVASLGLRAAVRLGFEASPTFAVLGSVAVLLLWLYVIGYVLVGAAALTATLEDRTT